MAGMRRKAGTVLVETALILPLLLILTFGLIEYGWMFYKTEQISNAARQGVRVAVRPDATVPQVQGSVGSLLNAAGLGSSGYDVSLTPSDISKAKPGDLLMVQITVPYQNIRLTGLRLLPTPDSLTAAVSMAKEGP